jgi:hypothetical protein
MMKSKDLEGKLSWHDRDTFSTFAWRALGKPQRTSIRIACVSVEMRSKQLPNASLGIYRYTNLLGRSLLFSGLVHRG